MYGVGVRGTSVEPIEWQVLGVQTEVYYQSDSDISTCKIQENNSPKSQKWQISERNLMKKNNEIRHARGKKSSRLNWETEK